MYQNLNLWDIFMADNNRKSFRPYVNTSYKPDTPPPDFSASSDAGTVGWNSRDGLYGPYDADSYFTGTTFTETPRGRSVSQTVPGMRTGPIGTINPDGTGASGVNVNVGLGSGSATVGIPAAPPMDPSHWYNVDEYGNLISYGNTQYSNGRNRGRTKLLSSDNSFDYVVPAAASLRGEGLVNPSWRAKLPEKKNYLKSGAPPASYRAPSQPYASAADILEMEQKMRKEGFAVDEGARYNAMIDNDMDLEEARKAAARKVIADAILKRMAK